LPCKNEKNRAEFEAHLAVREERDHGQHDAGKKTEHRDGLQNIEERDEDDFGAFGAGRQVAIGKREGQAQRVSNADAHE
jgi:hypothetical protein